MSVDFWREVASVDKRIEIEAVEGHGNTGRGWECLKAERSEKWGRTRDGIIPEARGRECLEMKQQWSTGASSGFPLQTLGAGKRV